MIVLLDTSVLIDILNGRRQRMDFTRDLVQQGHVLASCAVTIAEVYAGMLPSEAEATGALLDRLEYFATTQIAAKRAGHLKAVWRKKGHVLALPDVLVAAVALEHDLTLATDNRKHFPMPDLKLLPLPALH
jgi:predicted nucleic acid-binding protein